MREYIFVYLTQILQGLAVAAVLSVGGWLTIRKLFPDHPRSSKCLVFIGGAALVAAVLPIQVMPELHVAVLAFGIVAVLDHLREKRD